MSKNFFNENSASASINFPSSIEITEKKAPTDESVEILRDMEEKALKNVIAKVSGCNNNVVIWEAYFSKVASLSFEMMGILTLRMRINGKVYIGKSQNIEKRFNEHIYCLNRGINHNPHFQNHAVFPLCSKNSSYKA